MRIGLTIEYQSRLAARAGVSPEVIFDELVNGLFTDASRDEFARIIARLGERTYRALYSLISAVALGLCPMI